MRTAASIKITLVQHFRKHLVVTLPMPPLPPPHSRSKAKHQLEPSAAARIDLSKLSRSQLYIRVHGKPLDKSIKVLPS